MYDKKNDHIKPIYIYINIYTPTLLRYRYAINRYLQVRVGKLILVVDDAYVRAETCFWRSLGLTIQEAPRLLRARGDKISNV